MKFIIADGARQNEGEGCSDDDDDERKRDREKECACVAKNHHCRLTKYLILLYRN